MIGLIPFECLLTKIGIFKLSTPFKLGIIDPSVNMGTVIQVPWMIQQQTR